MKLRGLGISTNADMINGDDTVLARHLGEITDAGCTHAELILHGLDVVVGGKLQPSRVRAVGDVLTQAGLDYTIHLPYSLNLMDRQHGDEYRSIFESGIDFAGAVGAEVVVYHSSFRNADELDTALPSAAGDLIKRDLDTLSELGRRSAAHGVVIGVENNAWTDPQALTYGLRPSDLAAHVRQVDSDNVGVTLDLGHLHLTSAAYGWDFFDECEAVLPLLKHIHAHDNFAVLAQTGIYNRDLPLGLGDLHLPMGWGTIAWDQTIPRFADYTGVWMMEIEYRLASLFPEFVRNAETALSLTDL
jgi:sugar phosphate isomerase/epimerase